VPLVVRPDLSAATIALVVPLSLQDTSPDIASDHHTPLGHRELTVCSRSGLRDRILPAAVPNQERSASGLIETDNFPSQDIREGRDIEEGLKLG